MNVATKRFITGAGEARGTAVIIDVFRAFSLEAYLTAQGAENIIPVGDIRTAWEYREKDPGVILIGERRGIKLEGFDFGNSPSEVAGTDFAGKTVIHTTSAGTQGIAAARHADEILTGSLVNAAAIARYLKSKQPDEVTLVCMGTDGTVTAEEDELCAAYIRSLLADEPFPIAEEIAKLRYTGGAKFFDPALSEVFPTPDFAYCTAVDRFDFVLRVEKQPDGTERVRRIG